MKRKHVRLLGFLLISGSYAFSQTTAKIYPSADTEINQGAGTSVAGTNSVFQIYPWTTSFSKRAVIRFDLTAFAGCTINSAWLVMMEQSTNTVSRTINVHRITKNWSENTTHWTSPWTTSGGDFAGSAVGSFSPTWTGTIKKDSVELTSSVQSFTNGTFANYGWLLKISSEDATQQYWVYYSKEVSTISYRPILRIRYTGCTVLPIELLNFNVQANAMRQVEISWQTASEINNDFFTVESSIDGEQWEERGTIKGAGNSSALLSYSLTDENPFAGTSYYRLKQTDFDGKFSYSTVKDVNLTRVDADAANIYPNPAEDHVTFVGSRAELVNFKIHNLLGEDVTNRTKEITATETERTLDIKNLSSGIYYIKTATTVRKLYKQ